MLAFLIYLLGVVDKFNKAIEFIFVLSLVFVIVVVTSYLYFQLSEDEGEIELLPRAKKYVNIGFVIFLLSSSFTIFVPSSGTIAAMYLIPKISQQEEIKEIPDKALRILDLKLGKWIDELSEEKAKD